MKILFRDLKVGDKFKFNPYDPWWSEKASDVDAFVDVSSKTYKRISVREDAEVIKRSFKA